MLSHWNSQERPRIGSAYDANDRGPRATGAVDFGAVWAARFDREQNPTFSERHPHVCAAFLGLGMFAAFYGVLAWWVR